MMSVLGFSHVSVQVRDIEAALRLYRDVLGLVISVDEVQSFRAVGSDGNERDFRRRAVYLRWEDKPAAGFVVLGQQLLGDAGNGDAKALQDFGIDHVSFFVDDMDATIAKARALDIEVLAEPFEDHGPSYAFPDETVWIRTALLRDPERNIIQVDQWLGVRNEHTD